MVKKHLILIGLFTTLVVIISIVSFFAFYVDTPANIFEQKIKGMPNVIFSFSTKEAVYAGLEHSTGETSFCQTDEAGFIQAVKQAQPNGCEAYIFRADNTFYYMSEGAHPLYYTP